MKLVARRKIYFGISLLVLLAGIVSILVQGLNLGLDFKGGNLMTVPINQEYDSDELQDLFVKYGAKDASVQKSEGNTAIIRFSTPAGKSVSTARTDLYQVIKGKYTKAGEAVIESISATTSKELVLSVFWTLIIAFVSILIYVWIRFELDFGIAAIVGIVHDLLVMVAVVSIFRIQMNATFIAVVLTLAGYSLNNLVVVFDRIRENMKQYNPRTQTCNSVMEVSVQQSLNRTINTSVMTLATLLALYIFGVESIRDFTMPIIIGIIANIYSGIFIDPLVWALLATRREKHENRAK